MTRIRTLTAVALAALAFGLMASPASALADYIVRDQVSGTSTSGYVSMSDEIGGWYALADYQTGTKCVGNTKSTESQTWVTPDCSSSSQGAFTGATGMTVYYQYVEGLYFGGSSWTPQLNRGGHTAHAG